jgi:hypothetical protein
MCMYVDVRDCLRHPGRPNKRRALFQIRPLTEIERSALSSLVPDSSDEALVLIPTLSRFNQAQIEDILLVLQPNPT